MKRIAGLISLMLSIFLFFFGWYLIWERTNPYRLSLVPEKKQVRMMGIPDTIAMPSAGISLPVFAARYHNKTWDYTSKGVSYWTATPEPGNPGNSVLYGHNWSNLLGPMKKVKPGDKIYVSYGSRTIPFTVYFVTMVDPSNVSILAPTSDTRLTIYTCYGFLDSKRLVVTAMRDPEPKTPPSAI